MSAKAPKAQGQPVTLTGQHLPEAPAAVVAGLIKALNHPIRRAVLRFLLTSGPANSTEARQAITRYAAPNLINFHLDILEKAGAVCKNRPELKGSPYSHTELVQADWFLKVLELTATEDIEEGSQESDLK